MCRYVVLPLVAVFALLSAAPAGDPKGKLTAEEQRILDLTNEARKKEKLEPLKLQPALTAAARKHAGLMAKHKKLAHDFEGQTHRDRLKEVGYNYSEFGANVISTNDKGAKLPDTVVAEWLKSDINRANMLDKRFTEAGVAVAVGEDGNTYVTLLFGTPRN
jgi:uncharacterized protein YkwD